MTKIDLLVFFPRCALFLFFPLSVNSTTPISAVVQTKDVRVIPDFSFLYLSSAICCTFKIEPIFVSLSTVTYLVQAIIVSHVDSIAVFQLDPLLPFCLHRILQNEIFMRAKVLSVLFTIVSVVTRMVSGT